MTEDIVRRCAKNDRKAQAAFYSHYKRQVMGICLRYAGNDEEAKDIFQEAFVKIFLQVGKIRDVVALPAWVKQVTVNTAINHYHKMKKHRTDADLEEVTEVAGEEYKILLQQMDNQALLDLVNTLPPGYKMVFNLYAVEGYTHPQIAKMLGVSENTSKSQLSRARAMLRNFLQKRGIKNLTNYA